MAIGDAWGQFMGTANVQRQPASGVEEKLTMVLKSSTTDSMIVTNDTLDQNMMQSAWVTHVPSNTNFADSPPGFFLTNTNFLEKEGTTDTFYAGGVQTNI
jgi:hypothetical protein